MCPPITYVKKLVPGQAEKTGFSMVVIMCLGAN